MDPDDPIAALRASAADTLSDNLAAAPVAPQGEGQTATPPPGAPAATAPSPSPNDCEFTFIGGGGVGGPYLDSFRKAFQDAGIQNVRVPNQGGGLSTLPRVLVDAASVPAINDLRFAKSLVDSPSVKAAAAHSRSLGDEQYNLGGYSYGAAGAAANAYAIAQNGGKVDNLVLLGAPINQDLYEAVKTHPNIKNVITMDLGAQGDPIHAGMSDLDFAKAVPTLVSQWSRGDAGHFFYSKPGALGDARRAALAQTLAQHGVQ